MFYIIICHHKIKLHLIPSGMELKEKKEKIKICFSLDKLPFLILHDKKRQLRRRLTIKCNVRRKKKIKINTKKNLIK